MVSRSFPPHVMEHINSYIFGFLAIRGDPQNQGKDDSMHFLEKRMQRKLITAGQSSDEPNPLILGHPDSLLIGIQNIAESFRFLVTSVHRGARYVHEIMLSLIRSSLSGQALRSNPVCSYR